MVGCLLVVQKKSRQRAALAEWEMARRRA